MALIKEHILGKGGQIRSVIIQLPNKQLVSRAINHVFPLEIYKPLNLKILRMKQRLQLMSLVHQDQMEIYNLETTTE